MKKLENWGLKTNNRVYVIAEIGINHGGDIELAKKMIVSAAKAGVDAVKFQTYITEQRTPKDSPIFDILKQCELPFSAFVQLKLTAEENGAVFFSTPFDKESLDLLESIACPVYKLASFDVTNLAFLSEVAKTKKPVVMSVGMASLAQIQAGYGLLDSSGSKVSLLHCISAYPTRAEDANLSAISVLQQNFDCPVGQSDHTPGIEIPLFAVAAGAQILEKHYKIDDHMKCPDAPVSITEQQMTRLVNETRQLESILSDGKLGLRKAEEGCAVFRRKSELI